MHDVLHKLEAMAQVTENETPSWFIRAAWEAAERRHFRIITGRGTDDPYMLRFWLAPPMNGEDGMFESCDTALLHWFLRPDDDDALHDHPFDFTTTILSGGYTEARPFRWSGGDGPTKIRHHWRACGQTLVRKATDLHSIASIAHNTWTLVRTGPRLRPWGFHPAGKPWVAWREYLNVGAPS